MRRWTCLMLGLLFCLMSPQAWSWTFYKELSPQALVRINAFRAHPLKFASLFGLTEETVREKWGALGPEVLQGLPPLIEDPDLTEILETYITQGASLEALLSHQADGRTPELRLLLLKPLFSSEVLLATAFENYLPPEAALEILLDYLFRGALENRLPQGVTLLFPLYQRAGLVLAADQVPLKPGGPLYNVYLLGLLLTVEDLPPDVLCGRVLPQGVPSTAIPEKGLPGVSLTFKGPFHEARIFSWLDGSFYLPQARDFSLLTLEKKGYIGLSLPLQGPEALFPFLTPEP